MTAYTRYFFTTTNGRYDACGTTEQEAREKIAILFGEHVRADLTLTGTQYTRLCYEHYVLVPFGEFCPDCIQTTSPWVQRAHTSTLPVKEYAR